MKWKIKDIIYELKDNEKQIYQKKLMLESSVYLRDFIITDEIKDYVSVIYDEKQTQVLYLEVIIPPNIDEVEFLQSLKQYAVKLRIEKDAEI